MALTAVAADVLVIGAGPAGIAAVLALRGRKTTWVDPMFRSGRLDRFQTVECNTKVDLLTGPKFFNHPLLTSVSEAIAPEIDRLTEDAHPLPGSTDPSEKGWTHLGACKRVYDAATNELRNDSNITCIEGHVIALHQHDSDNLWKAVVAASDTQADGAGGTMEVHAHIIVVATGSQPMQRSISESCISAEHAFDKEALKKHIGPSSKVAVVGNSHSAAIVLSRLQDLADELDLKVANFVRRPVRLAEWCPDLSTYRYTSTGLKGFGAVVGSNLMAKGAESWLEVRQCNTLVPADWDLVIDCTGYEPTPLPNVSGSTLNPVRDECTGRLGLNAGLPNLYGVGAPWGEPAGRLWGVGMEEAEGFKGEDSFIGFHLFFDRAQLIAREIELQHTR